MTTLDTLKLADIIAKSAVLAEQLRTDDVHGIFPEDVLNVMITKYPKQVGKEDLRMARQGWLRRIEKHLKAAIPPSESEDEPQWNLPGLVPPGYIAVRPDGGGKCAYVTFGNATWNDLETALTEREDNIKNAVDMRRDWREKMDYLMPVMKDDPTMTVASAIGILHQTQ